MKPTYPIYCKTAADIPSTPHYAILTARSIEIPGDERSRTHPGHGYPASTEQVWDYVVYGGKEQWEEAVDRQHARSLRQSGAANYKAMYVTPATITTTTKVEL